MAHNYNDINRHNCEEYFLLYVDNELPAEGRRAVEHFVLQNPDLAAELEALQQATLAPQPVHFTAKNALYKTIPEITLDNYTEYFAQQADNELNADGAAALELFLQRQPQLREELALFEATRLPAETVAYDDKISLYKNTGAGIINGRNYTEFFALYADNELDAAGKTAVEAFAAAEPGMRNELNLFLQARLQPDMQVQYPDKAGLYRQEETRRRVIPLWQRFAAAAAVLAFVAWLAFNGAGSSSGKGGNPVAVNDKDKSGSKQPVNVQQPADNNADNNNVAGTVTVTQNPGAGTGNDINGGNTDNTQPAIITPNKSGNNNEGIAVTKQGVERNNKRNEQAPVPVNQAGTPNENRNIAVNKNEKQYVLPRELKAMLNTQQQPEEAVVLQNSQPQPEKNSVKPPVQQDAVLPAANLDAGDEGGSDVAIMNVPAGNTARKGGIRGLSRKVSRFFERKIKNFGNSPVSVGGFEVAVAR